MAVLSGNGSGSGGSGGGGGGNGGNGSANNSNSSKYGTMNLIISKKNDNGDGTANNAAAAVAVDNSDQLIKTTQSINSNIIHHRHHNNHLENRSPSISSSSSSFKISSSGLSGSSSSMDNLPMIPARQISLKKELGLINCVAIIVGIIVGSGIFVSPRGVLQESGSVGLSLIIWILCGLLSTMGALCYAELGTSFPESGGDYAYIKKAFGPLPAFLYIWVQILIIQPGGNAIAAMTFANYILQSMYPTCTPPDNAIRLIAALVIVILIFINCYNVKLSTMVQDWFTLTKIIALILIIIFGVVQFIRKSSMIEENLSFPNSFDDTTRSPGHISLAFYSGIFSYAGWNYLNFVVEELHDPFRNLPRAIYISLPLVTIIYLLANISYFTVLSKEEILTTNAVAVTFGERLMSSSFAWIMPLSVAMSTFGGLNGCIFSSSRLFFVGAREGHLPKSLAMINLKYFTPIPSLILLGLLSLLYLCTTEIFVLINYTTFIESSSILASIGSLLMLRYKYPNHQRPIKFHVILPITFFLICLFLVILPFYVQPYETIIGIFITISGIPIYLLTIYWKSKPKFYSNSIDWITQIIQKVFYCIPEE